MTLEEFLESVADSDQPADHLSGPLQSLWYAEKGQWEESHRIAQDIASPEGSWVHACLHREEGDDGNAAYWYARANRPPSTLSLTEERHAMIETLLQHEE